MSSALRIYTFLFIYLVGFQLHIIRPAHAATLNPSVILSLINLTRTNQGVAPLHPDISLDQAAANKAHALIDQNQFSHDLNQQPPWVYFDQVGYRYTAAGENLAQGFSSETGIVEAWLNSPSHAANLLSPDFTHSGLGIATDKQNNSIVVHLLASPLPIEIVNYSPKDYRQTTPISQSSNHLIAIIIALITGLLLIVSFRRRHPTRPASPNRAWWQS